ncbi:hypothetical protein KK062_06755 [Fulvivirgaceae bacterium PWU5]|uniref:Uncharacterized protein n=1 Tax=Dawidia cretensis TaxID=2782350 RepID=A0AAP2DXP2_9BACT|nr:hypothetical protein [Dawidia cretensis]MBT1707912.1 hypothetical protein [Dawidia cretensis]
MERCNINLLIEKTLHLLQDEMSDKDGETPTAATVEIQKLRGDDGKVYKLSVRVELFEKRRSGNEG